MSALDPYASHLLEEHPDGLRLTVDDTCEMVSVVLTPGQWHEMKIAGDRILRRRSHG